jgi:hypothetical protein
MSMNDVLVARGLREEIGFIPDLICSQRGAPKTEWMRQVLCGTRVRGLPWRESEKAGLNAGPGPQEG